MTIALEEKKIPIAFVKKWLEPMNSSNLHPI